MKQQAPWRRDNDDIAIRPAVAVVTHKAAVAIAGLHNDAVRRPTEVDEPARRKRLDADRNSFEGGRRREQRRRFEELAAGSHAS